MKKPVRGESKGSGDRRPTSTQVLKAGRKALGPTERVDKKSNSVMGPIKK